MDTRTETDSMGDIQVPHDALWGAQTQRSLENFNIGEQVFPKEFIHSYAQLKKAAAIVNGELGQLDNALKKAIVKACDEIIAGQHERQFPLKIWQTGSGTQTNMNLNEVIANRASEIMGGKRGDKSPVHPNDHVNLSQSSNDSFPTAMHITIATLAKQWLMPALNILASSLEEKQNAFSKFAKSGRTHLMDATPITVGQEFSGYLAQLKSAHQRIEQSLNGVYQLAIGGTAVGTGLNSSPLWAGRIAEQLTTQMNLPFVSAENKFAALAAHDAIADFHGSLKLLATSLLKIGNDIRLLASGPRCGLNELTLPSNEPGSSIMPGKVNPTQIEALTMVCVAVMGNDTSVSIANSQGHLELNVYKPLIFIKAFESIQLLSDAINSFTEHCLRGIEVNKAQLQKHLDNSLMLVTALAPHIGYDNAAKVAKHAYEKETTLLDAVLELELLSESEYKRIVNPFDMLGP